MRNRRSTGPLLAAGLIGLLALFGLLTWANYRYTLANPGGNDFLVHWLGTRSFLIQGYSPYSDETALQIQNFAYGRPAKAGEHELRVAYPLYSVIFFFPFALFGDFTFARALWMTVLEISLALTALFSLRLTDWRPNIINLVVYLLFTLLWYHGGRPLINGNAVIIVGLLLVGALLAIRAKADELAGVLLGFATIKPQVVVLPILFILFYAAWNQRWRLIAWTIGTVVILSGAAAFLLPDWLLQNIREILRYPGYNPPGTPGTALAVWLPALGERLGWAFSAGVGIILIAEWVAARHADFRGFLWTTCLTIVLSPWIGIQTDPGNFVTLFPALTLCFALLDDRWRRWGWLFSLLTMFLLLGGLWWIFLNTLETVNGQPQQSPVMFFPLPAVVGILLLWVRWWAFHPPNLWFNLLYEKENPR